MKKSPLLLLVIGLLLLAVGGVLTMGSVSAEADPAIVARCEARMQDQGAEMIAHCKEKAFATGMTATDANEAARTISAANNSEVGRGGLGMFLIGLGAVLAIVGVIAWRQQDRAKVG
ncbi:hypothetical protein [Sphingomonas crusticola]|uniref:hypothetical protein n=1 Tax=Sphingomonas crusticola TaxID=1697973 RepID=UPI000E25CAD7|nr:hypothetical protein [Sphingomonas crusticola]